MQEPKRTINLAYRPVIGYTVTSTINTLYVLVGQVLSGDEVKRLIADGFTVKVST